MKDTKLTIQKPKIGLLPVGHFYYWDQFPELREMGLGMYKKLLLELEKIGIVEAPDLVDTIEKARGAARFFKEKEIDILLVFPFGYAPSMCVLPAVQESDVPLRILNAHENSSYDYRRADTTEYL
ncbi:MAG: hypothetical protein HN368_11585, partial [Spirochaetales bacterium]|nr:hypothetical protein [Spirochaetales bacterium]